MNKNNFLSNYTKNLKMSNEEIYKFKEILEKI
jgi:hypothetical protein